MCELYSQQCSRLNDAQNSSDRNALHAFAFDTTIYITIFCARLTSKARLIFLSDKVSLWTKEPKGVDLEERSGERDVDSRIQVILEKDGGKVKLKVKA